MFISRLILTWLLLLNTFNTVLMHEIEGKFMNASNSSGLVLSPDASMRVTPRQSAYGGFTYLAVSLLFQLPLMEIIFVMGLTVLVLGIMLHFVELKADFFRLRRAFLREEKLRIKLERDEAIRNRTEAMEAMANSSMVDPINGMRNGMNGMNGNEDTMTNGMANGMNGNGNHDNENNGNGNNGNPMNGAFNQDNQDNGNDGTKSYVNYNNYANEGNHGSRYNGEQLESQSSHAFPAMRAPQNRYHRRKRPLRRRITGRQPIPPNIDQLYENMNFQRRQGYPQRVNPLNRWQQAMTRREQMMFG